MEKGTWARLGFVNFGTVHQIVIDCESGCVDWLSKGGVVGGFNSRGRLTPLKGGRLEGWRERGIQSGVEGIRRWGLVPLLESKDLFSINKVAV